MKIVVVGAGIGGMLVAEKLGGLGFDVVVYEKANSLDEMRYDWHDDVSPVVFEELGLTIPKESAPKLFPDTETLPVVVDAVLVTSSSQFVSVG